jgi:hypothetical protein
MKPKNNERLKRLVIFMRGWGWIVGLCAVQMLIWWIWSLKVIPSWRVFQERLIFFLLGFSVLGGIIGLLAQWRCFQGLGWGRFLLMGILLTLLIGWYLIQAYIAILAFGFPSRLVYTRTFIQYQKTVYVLEWQYLKMGPDYGIYIREGRLPIMKRLATLPNARSWQPESGIHFQGPLLNILQEPQLDIVRDLSYGSHGCFTYNLETGECLESR